MTVKANAPVPLDWSGNDKQFGESVKENLDVLTGNRGDPLDKAITARDLIGFGIAQLPEGQTTFATGNSLQLPDPHYNDLPSVPQPTGLTAAGAFQFILVTWNLLQYRGHSHVEIYRSNADNVSALDLSTPFARVPFYTNAYSDQVGSAQTFYYWVRAVNLNGDVGALNSASGTLGQTGTDVSVLLTTLNGAITTTELATELATPIANVADLITHTGYSAGLSSTLEARAQALETASTAQTSTNSGFQSSINTLTSNVSSLTSTLASSTAGIFVSDNAPVAGQNSVPNPIPTNSRWYESDNNNKPYYWNGSSWVALDDPRIAQNSSDITSLNNQVFDTDGTTPRLATSSSVTALDSTVVNQGNSITSISGNVTNLRNDVYQNILNVTEYSLTSDYVIANPSADPAVAASEVYFDGKLYRCIQAVSARTAWASGTTFSSGNIVAHNNILYTAASTHSGQEPPNSTYWTVTADSFAPTVTSYWTAFDPVPLATASAVSGLSSSVTSQAGQISTQTSDITNLKNEVFSSGTTGRLATQATTTGLDSRLTTTESTVTGHASDITRLRTDIYKNLLSYDEWSNSTDYSNNATHEVLYDGKLYLSKNVASNINQPPHDTSDVVNSTYWQIFTSPALASTTAISGLSQTVNSEADLLDIAQGDITNLKTEVFSSGTTGRLATINATNGLQQQVLAIYDPDNPSNVTQISTVQSDITNLETNLFQNLLAYPAWSGSTNYSNDQTGFPFTVHHKGVLYQSKNVTGNSNQEPPNALYWDVFSQPSLASAQALSGLRNEVKAIYDDSNPTLANTQIGITQGFISSLGNNLYQSIAGFPAYSAQQNYGGAGEPTKVVYNGKLWSHNQNSSNQLAAPPASPWTETQPSRLADNSVLSQLSNDVRAIYDPNSGNATQISTLQSDITNLQSDVFKQISGFNDWAVDQNYVQANSSAAPAVVASEVHYNGQLYRSLTDHTSSVSNRPPSSDWVAFDPPPLAQTSALDTLTNSVNYIYNASADSGLVEVLQQKVTNLETALMDGDNPKVTANAFSALETEVLGDGTAQSSRIDSLNAAVFDNGNVKLASASAVDTLNAQVFEDNGVGASRIAGLEAEVFVTDVNGNKAPRLTAVTAFDEVKVKVFPDGTGETDAISTLNSTIFNTNEDGSINTGSPKVDASIFDSLRTAVFPNGEASVSSISTLQTTVGESGLAGAITNLQNVTTGTNGLTTKYSVKVDNNGYVSGFGLLSEANDATTTSAFIVSANKFVVVDPNDNTIGLNPDPTETLFEVVGADETINGVSVSKGVYLKDTFIKNGSITTAHIANANIDIANVSGNLTANRITGVNLLDASVINIDGNVLTTQTVNGGVPQLILQTSSSATTGVKIENLSHDATGVQLLVKGTTTAIESLGQHTSNGNSYVKDWEDYVSSSPYSEAISTVYGFTQTLILPNVMGTDSVPVGIPNTEIQESGYAWLEAGMSLYGSMSNNLAESAMAMVVERKYKTHQNTQYVTYQNFGSIKRSGSSTILFSPITVAGNIYLNKDYDYRFRMYLFVRYLDAGSEGTRGATGQFIKVLRMNTKDRDVVAQLGDEN